MYLASILALLLFLPIASILVELIAHTSTDLVLLFGKWFVFWAGGVRLFLAGIRQVMQPSFTAATIFEITDKSAEKIVTELGLANLAMGALAIVSIFNAAWVVPAAIVSGLYYAFAGIKHATNAGRNGKQTLAMVSDLAVAVVLLGFVAVSLLAR